VKYWLREVIKKGRQVRKALASLAISVVNRQHVLIMKIKEDAALWSLARG
jgi:hypothetical protein